MILTQLRHPALTFRSLEALIFGRSLEASLLDRKPNTMISLLIKALELCGLLM